MTPPVPYRKRGIVALVGTTAALTLVGRAVGLLSQTLVAGTFGAGQELDAFLIAILIPGLVIAPIEGAIETMIAPRVARLEAEQAGGSSGFARTMLRRSLTWGLGLALVATIASPVLVQLSAPSAAQSTLAIAGSLALITYPTIGVRLVTATCLGLLLGRGSMRAPVAVQTVNPAAIVLMLLLVDATPTVLAVAAAAGWALEALILVGLVYQRGRTPAEEEVSPPELRALGVVAFTYALVQISPTIDQVFASGLGVGGLATFVIAVRLYEVATSLLILPVVRIAQNDLGVALSQTRAFWDAWRRSFQRCAVAGVLSSAGLVIAGPVVIDAAFRHGAFSPTDAAATREVMLVLAIGLIPGAVGYLLGRTLVVLNLRRQLTGVMVVQVLTNIGLDAVLIRPFGGPGLAAATLATSVVGNVVMYRTIRRQRLLSADPAVVPQLELEDRPES